MIGNIDQLAKEIQKQFGLEFCVPRMISDDMIKVEFAAHRDIDGLQLVGPVGLELNKRIRPFRIVKSVMNDVDESSYLVLEYYISI